MRHLTRLSFLAFAVVAANAEDSIRLTRALPKEGGNSYYAANRPPLVSSPLIKLPVGSVQAGGWLRLQLDLMAAGFTGHLEEISQFCRFDGNAWTSRTGQGKFGWEEVPYWLKGFADLGYLTGDERIQKEARRWIEAVLSSQLPNGYFGSRANLSDAESGARVLDLWPNMVMLYPLRSYYEATGDRRVLDFMTRYFRWQATVPLDRFLPASWQKWRAGDNLDSIYWLYNRTGEPWLLDLARVNHERTADWIGGIPTWHGVNLAQCFREPAQYYQQTHDSRYLDATSRVYETVMSLYGQFPGGMFAADENARPGFSGPRQGSETCAMVEMMHSAEMLLRITGDAAWADRAEDVAFNSLPASMTADLKALHYLTAANQVSLDRADKSPMIENSGDQFSYNPYQYRCCQHNVAFGWPYFAETLWLATPNNGLAAAFYAPGKVMAKVGDGAEVSITSETKYPFSSEITMRIGATRPVRFPLALRLPAWSQQPALRINQTEIAIPPGKRNWVAIERVWHDGDSVRLALPMKVHVRRWERNHNAVSVDRGPLTYSLRIAENWKQYGNDPHWPAYEVTPASPWNYALVLNAPNAASSFRELEVPTHSAQPFSPDGVPLILRARAKRIPQWTIEPNGMIGELQASPVETNSAEEEISLMPMGAARLRITAFPEAAAHSGARWQESSPLATLSRPSHFQPPSAMDDGLVGDSSADTAVPWAVWSDTYGSIEWAEYTFSSPRRVTSVDVYWADEGDARNAGGVHAGLRLALPGDGAVRVPRSWKLLYWDGTAWQAVRNHEEFGIQTNKFNHVTFDPVATTALRLDALLEPGNTAGIIEWRVGEEQR